MLKVLKSGLYTTIQDSGRFGYRDNGVPVSGVMDTNTVYKINTLLENDVNDSVLEITMTGPTLQFGKDTYISLGGAKFEVTLNNIPVENYKLLKIMAGDILSYGRLQKGFRAYIAIKNGFQSKEILGSRSYYSAITPYIVIKDNFEIPYIKNSKFEPKITSLKTNSLLDETELYVAKGPEFSLLNDRQLEQIFFREFNIAPENNRMAYQLKQTIDGHKVSMLTSATLPGTVQFTPAGKLIVLMKDGQTTGGYPRIIQLTDKAISILSQKKSGDIVNFKLM
ncbi:biotin-dependent carboxyltransferase family protein [Cellulophaga baltica]|uniref:5-oxoprolinase subunit C family protein n=1 Tax=Cellulophaga TaxID=104264 RepID=UPI001C06835F|nr:MULTISPECIES: biotin-dependent carboxyltransferase family protein [Cellulophaga]MBU2997514.1 biotin-dependent carboxyltransferase family protein [Cellulophaga baltica]MDO6768909.1 biotin-dependent carboxyltransferase family protein [Cellulophaga sp. 1_MG-2023]